MKKRLCERNALPITGTKLKWISVVGNKPVKQDIEAQDPDFTLSLGPSLWYIFDGGCCVVCKSQRPVNRNTSTAPKLKLLPSGGLRLHNVMKNRTYLPVPLKQHLARETHGIK